MVKKNILKIRINGQVVYQKVDCIPTREDITSGKNSANSIDLKVEVLECKEA